VDRGNVADDSGPVAALAHVGDRQFGEQKRRPQHEPLHQVILFHGEVVNGIDVLQPGDVGDKPDRSQLGRVRNGLGNLRVVAQVGLDENHLAAHVACDFLGLLALFFVDVEPDRHRLFAAAAMAVARPIPVPAPVTMHTLPTLSSHPEERVSDRA
jgi:hypothetical protein